MNLLPLGAFEGGNHRPRIVPVDALRGILLDTGAALHSDPEVSAGQQAQAAAYLEKLLDLLDVREEGNEPDESILRAAGLLGSEPSPVDVDRVVPAVAQEHVAEQQAAVDAAWPATEERANLDNLVEVIEYTLGQLDSRLPESGAK